ncbi:LysR substrate-binding domain-containing protein [Carnimonas nigrificans]|uniref:LysR substrate-binding domain-containing protein n=1 Tax=Carnimonas nigrificans TaxID=64323 RepID=UPI00047123F2|nr:LysR substrate-binding domain-containing protein [Carnimonas nigrificans]
MQESRLKLPPLNALRTFEAAARHVGFNKAADELFVTPAAVSRQIKVLEDYFGVALFKRNNRSIELTEEGMLLQPIASHALQQLASASEALLQRRHRSYLMLAISSAFAQLWFMPRFASLNQLYPELQLHMLSREGNPGLDEEFDAAVMLGKPQSPHYVAEYLFSEEVFPVCTPHFLAQHPEVATLHGLTQVTLVNLSQHHWASQLGAPIDWDFWFEAIGIQRQRYYREMQFSQFSMMIDAVRQGIGVGLAWRHLVEPQLESGELIQPLEERYMAKERCHYFVYDRKRANSPDIQALSAWLWSETAPLREHE